MFLRLCCDRLEHDLKLRVSPLLPFKKLMAHPKIVALAAGGAGGRKCVLEWMGVRMDMQRCPMDYCMECGIEASQRLDLIIVGDLNFSVPTVLPDDSGELLLLLKLARAKVTQLEHELALPQSPRRTSVVPATPTTSAEQESRLRSEVDALRKENQFLLRARELAAQHWKEKDAELAVMHKVKRRSMKEQVSQKQAEVEQWQKHFNGAVHELASAKLLIAEQRAILDRLGFDEFPYPDTTNGSFRVRKSYQLQDVLDNFTPI